MTQTQIRGSTQIIAGSISTDRLVSGWDSAFLKADGSVALSGDMALGGFKLTSLGDATSAQDAVNLRTLQSYVNGIAIKPAVRGVIASNQSLTGLPTSDGITYVANDIVLLTAQTSGSQNGPWVVASGSWTRPTWWSAASSQKPALFYVTEGTTYHDTKWTTITDGSITVDTTSVSITQDTTGTTYSAGNGISLTGATFAVKLGNGVQFDGSNNVAAKPYATRLITVDSNGIGITDGSSAQLIVANGSGNASWATMSGDATIGNTGVVAVNHTAGSGFLKYGDLVYNETPSGSVNGSNTSFSLASTPQNSSLKLFWNGVLLEPGSGNDYTISGTTITMLFTPTTGDKLRAYYTK